jgi:hypothetical protein
VRKLQKEPRYRELETTKELLALCRSDIVAARLMLASTSHLTVEQQAELWELIDAGELFIRMVSEDYSWQMEQIDRELEMELQS